ncbi:rhomboid family intramembrane serine protease [Corynebacterium heidelbergense]|uniref:Rhomboid family intramembrane serine protease n=1 Tax=Corynebacterium heidelbergense TaxID=2055947 RepID=A0A364V6M1_9CORY|nr:rhomboid family intramembrane serine protease [Corynebacterium heidelbergense]RAV32279.1 rhomboid family intramembrane serine protease [Corynebacterium heidelbergense]
MSAYQPFPRRLKWSDAPLTGGVIAVSCGVYLLMAVQAAQRVGLSAAITDPLQDPQNLGWKLMLMGGYMKAYDEGWRVLTAAVVHLNLTHLVLNCIFLALFGRPLERNLGSAVMAGLALTSAAGGAGASLLMHPEAPMGGASTIAYGMMALLLGLQWTHRDQLGATLVLVVLNFGFTLTTPGISLWGHVGGFVAGLAVFAVVRSAGNRRHQAARRCLALGVVSVLAAGAYGVFGLGATSIPLS